MVCLFVSPSQSVREAGELLKTAEQDWPKVQAALTRIRDAIVRKGNVVINLTGADDLLESSMPAIEKLLEILPSKDQPQSTTLQSTWKTDKQSMLLPMRNEGFAVPSQVNYVVKGGQMLQPGESVSGAFNVITRYLSNGYLWDNVRVVGGAYGGFAQFSEISGRFSFLSYRDPNLEKTLDTYNNALSALHLEEVSEESLKDSIIGTIGDIDSPQSPDQKGLLF